VNTYKKQSHQAYPVGQHKSHNRERYRYLFWWLKNSISQPICHQMMSKKSLILYLLLNFTLTSTVYRHFLLALKLSQWIMRQNNLYGRESISCVDASVIVLLILFQRLPIDWRWTDGMERTRVRKYRHLLYMKSVHNFCKHMIL